MSLVDKVKEKWEEMTSRLGPQHKAMNVRDIDDMIAQINNLLNEEQRESPQANNLRGYMSDLYHQNRQYKDAKDELLKLDWKERMRFLGFRIATAIGIAAVILTTGALASWLEIPLPLLRIAT